MAIRKIGNFDLILAGRQAIDGDTAQVGLRLLKKREFLGLLMLKRFRKSIRRRLSKASLDNGVEIVESPLPVLIT